MSDSEKRNAALKSVELVQDGVAVGLGTGSTVEYMIPALGERVREGLRLTAVPTSTRTERLAEKEGIPLASLNDVGRLDVTIDGADEVDASGNLVKGGGGALLREKIVAWASRQLVIIVDSSKLCERLGAFPLPIEVVPFARRAIARHLESLGAEAVVRSTSEGGRFVTDEGNQIIDCAFGEIADPAALARQLAEIPGLVEHGLFVGMADRIVIGSGEGVELRDYPGMAAQAASA